MKKLISLLTIISMFLFVLCSCGSVKNEIDKNDEDINESESIVENYETGYTLSA